MKYTISEENIRAINQVLFELNVGAKTLAQIINTLKANPIKEEEKKNG